MHGQKPNLKLIQYICFCLYLRNKKITSGYFLYRVLSSTSYINLFNIPTTSGRFSFIHPKSESHLSVGALNIHDTITSVIYSITYISTHIQHTIQNINRCVIPLLCHVITRFHTILTYTQCDYKINEQNERLKRTECNRLYIYRYTLLMCLESSTLFL